VGRAEGAEQMKSTFTTLAAAAAVWGLVTLPATAQSSGSGSAGAGSSQQGGSSSGSGATDQQGSTHGGQAGSSGTGQSGSGQTGTSGQSGTGQSGTANGSTPGSKGANAGSQGATARGSSQDRTFIMEAAAGGMAEVELGRLASQKASRSEVKEFGQMMVDDHTKANNELMEIAQEKGLAAPHALKPQDKTTEDQLSKLAGQAFDRAYMQHMVKDHKKDVALFRKQSTGASDADVKEFASSTLPTLEKHLKRAQELEQIVGAGGTAKGTSGTSPEDKPKKCTSPSGASGSGTTPPR
jgi:putative membrane protein